MSSVFIFNEYGIIGGACSLIALMLASHQIFMHLYFFKEPKFQLYIVRILLMVPIYSIQSWFSLIMPKYSMYFTTVRDWRGIIISTDREGTSNNYLIISPKKWISHPWPFNYYIDSSLITRRFFRNVKQGVLQFVFIKPFTAILSLILIRHGLYEEGNFSFRNYYLYLSVVNNISVSISLYCLVLFYMGFEEKLHYFRPFSKFVCIKFVIFFSFWQFCFLILLTKFDVFSHQTASFIQDMLICLEMVVAAIAHSFAFSYKDFVDYSKAQNPIRNLGKVLNVRDIIVDAENTFISDMEDSYQLEVRIRIT